MAFLDFFYLCWLVVVGHLIKMCVPICYSFWPAARPVMYSAHSNQFIKNQELSFSQFCCPNGQRIKMCVLCYSWPAARPPILSLAQARPWSGTNIQFVGLFCSWTERNVLCFLTSSHRRDGSYQSDDEHIWNADLLHKQWSALMGWGCDDLFERHLLSAALRSLRIDPVGAEDVKQGTCPKYYS